MSKIAITGALMVAGLLLLHPAQAQKLAERHKKWLETEVVYVVSKEEKDLFMRLGSDAQRDQFVDQFWARRDPTPGTPQNEHKDEHYRRINYANTYFGGEWNIEGWRSDRGKIYIILGTPATRQQYPSGGQIYPIELWFYNNPDEPSLPPFFNVLFFQKDGISDYRLYSPYLDGPTKLVRAAGAENRPDRAYRFLRDFNVEVARASLSLIPSEPVDVDATASLGSDSMLRKIVNIADDKFHKHKLGITAGLQQDVSVRLIPDDSDLRAVALPIVDVNGDSFLHYALQTTEPSTFALGRYKDQLYIAVEAHVRITDAKTKALVKEFTREATSYLAEKEVEEVKARPVSFEDRLPLAPGNYQVEFGLLNRLTRVFSRATISVHVEGPGAQGISVGRPVLVSKCQPAANLTGPFVFGTFRCGVSARNEVVQGATALLNLLYTVTASPEFRSKPQLLKVQYTIGRLDRGVPPRTVEDQLDTSRFDPRGRLYVGKSLPLDNLPQGNYLLSVQILESDGKGKGPGATFSFRIGQRGTSAGAEFKVLEPETAPKSN